MRFASKQICTKFNSICLDFCLNLRVITYGVQLKHPTLKHGHLQQKKLNNIGPPGYEDTYDLPLTCACMDSLQSIGMDRAVPT